MNDGGYTGYLFAGPADDMDPSDGLRKTRVLVVSRSVDEALDAAAVLTPREQLELIEVGADVLAEARNAGVKNDEAKLV